jgi:hypothetical protein
LGTTTSLVIPSATTPADKPGTPGGSTQEVVVKQTATGGIQVVEVKEPTVAPDPKLIGGKFKSQEELLSAYNELQTKLGGKKDEPIVPAPATTLTIESAAKLLTDKGLDYNVFSAQYAKDGALSSDSYGKLFAAGITAQQIDTFLTTQAPVIAAQKAAQLTSANEVMNSVGGAEEFAKLTAFAAVASDQAEVASYNRAVEAGDSVAAKIFLAKFKAQRDASLGVEPTLNGGTPPASGSTDVYQDREQYHADLRDPKYATDSYFRKKVDAKIERSKKLYT